MRPLQYVEALCRWRGVVNAPRNFGADARCELCILRGFSSQRAEPAAEAVGVMAAPAAADAGADEATTRADILKLFEIYDDDKSGFMCVAHPGGCRACVL